MGAVGEHVDQVVEDHGPGSVRRRDCRRSTSSYGRTSDKREAGSVGRSGLDLGDANVAVAHTAVGEGADVVDGIGDRIWVARDRARRWRCQFEALLLNFRDRVLAEGGFIDNRQSVQGIDPLVDDRFEGCDAKGVGRRNCEGGALRIVRCGNERPTFNRP